MAYERFNADNAAMLLIDYQVGTIEWMHSAPKKDVIRNVLALAKTAKELGMPVVLTSSQEDQVQGPMLPELKEILPEAYEKPGEARRHCRCIRRSEFRRRRRSHRA